MAIQSDILTLKYIDQLLFLVGIFVFFIPTLFSLLTNYLTLFSLRKTQVKLQVLVFQYHTELCIGMGAQSGFKAKLARVPGFLYGCPLTGKNNY